ncbi:SRPBCC domain-containing protein [Peribacillus frigoritolerans]|nr:SRPBCC domain-containing protein [Peribacillus frigoritolerans]
MGALTENDKVEKWMSNLEMKDLRKDGTIKFNFNDGSGKSFDMKIRDYRESAVLDFEWGDGWVRFEVSPEKDGCSLVLKEFITPVNDHTSKDLAGWHICLDMFSDLLDGHHQDFPPWMNGKNGIRNIRPQSNEWMDNGCVTWSRIHKEAEQ